MMEGNKGGGGLIRSFSRFITSSGCSNILKDRRNCLRGLTNGFDPFRTCPPIGDPLREFPAIKLLRDRGAAKGAGGKRETCFSWTGESAKISESDKDEEVAGLLLI
jgi:hypothetical protein